MNVTVYSLHSFCCSTNCIYIFKQLNLMQLMALFFVSFSILFICFLSTISGQMNIVEDELERRAVTYTLWNQSTSKTETGWHPITFSYADARPEHIEKIKVCLLNLFFFGYMILIYIMHNMDRFLCEIHRIFSIN